MFSCFATTDIAVLFIRFGTFGLFHLSFHLQILDKARKIPLNFCDLWSKVRAQLVSLVQIAKYQRYPEFVMAVMAFETHISMSDIFTKI